MHWDPKRNKWTSLTQQRKDERKEAMSLFRKKKSEGSGSAFDRIPQDSQDKLIEDVLSIVRTVRSWPELIPTELHAPIGEEVTTILRKTGLKLASAFMGSDDFGDALADALKGVSLPRFISQGVIAVKLALMTDKPTNDNSGGPDGTAA